MDEENKSLGWSEEEDLIKEVSTFLFCLNIYFNSSLFVRVDALHFCQGGFRLAAEEETS